MKKSMIFHICLAVVWFAIAIISAIMMFMGVQVDAITAFCPSMLCSFLYLDKILQINKQEK